jgi:SAM-dependent methyltransferase
MENIEYWVDQVYAAGGDRQQLNRLYDEWAAEYEQHKWATGNPVIAISAGLIGRHVDDFGARILDAGCGAGNLGQVLHQIGYDNLEALDPSAGMLEVARRKSIYRALHELFLEPGIDLPGKTYDLVAATGVFTEGHAPPEALDGMLELTRPGGIVLFSLTDQAAQNLGFDERIAGLNAAGAWRMLERTEPFRPFPFSADKADVRLRVYLFEKNGADA